MPFRSWTLAGIMAILILFGTISISIFVSPWFDWWTNALSDLGNLRNGSAPIFNCGLLLSGLLVILYSAKKLNSYARLTASSLMFTGFSLQLVGLFCENYGRIHFYVSVILFVSLFVSALTYVFEKKGYLGAIVLFGIPAWWAHFSQITFSGAAIPEMLSALLTLPWLFDIMVKAGKTT